MGMGSANWRAILVSKFEIFFPAAVRKLLQAGFVERKNRWMAKIEMARKSLKIDPLSFQKGSIRSLRSGTSAFLRRWLFPAARSAKSKTSVASIQGARNVFSADSMGNSSARPQNPLNWAEIAQENCATNPKQSLLVQALTEHGSCRFLVSGSSMLPTLWPGDLVLIQRRPLQQLVVGDVVLHQSDGRFFLHRLESCQTHDDRVYFVTRGDAMPQRDPPFSSAHLLGVLAGVQRDGDWLSLPLRMPATARVLAALVRRSSQFSRLFLLAHERRAVFVANQKRLAEAS